MGGRAAWPWPAATSRRSSVGGHRNLPPADGHEYDTVLVTESARIPCRCAAGLAAYRFRVLVSSGFVAALNAPIVQFGAVTSASRSLSWRVLRRLGGLLL